MGQLLEQAGGDPGKALELFKSGAYKRAAGEEEAPAEEVKEEEASPYAPPKEEPMTTVPAAVPAEVAAAPASSTPAAAESEPTAGAIVRGTKTSKPAPEVQTPPPAATEASPVPVSAVVGLPMQLTGPLGERLQQRVAGEVLPGGPTQPSREEDAQVLANFEEKQARMKNLDALMASMAPLVPTDQAKERRALELELSSLVDDVAAVQLREEDRTAMADQQRLSGVSRKVQNALHLVSSPGAPFRSVTIAGVGKRFEVDIVPPQNMTAEYRQAYQEWNGKARTSGIPEAKVIADLRDQLLVEADPGTARELQKRITENAQIIAGLSRHGETLTTVAQQGLEVGF
jgi:hypothetical protein